MYPYHFLQFLPNDLRELVHGHVHCDEVEDEEEDCSITEPATADLVRADTDIALADTTQADTAQADTAQAYTMQADMAQADTKHTNTVQADTSHDANTQLL